ncbi:MAG: hypothetical protein HQ589_07350 [Syntrophaceae bacterium]|nr:hypothetical protein [Syntrophaceae bacterium]
MEKFETYRDEAQRNPGQVQKIVGCRYYFQSTSRGSVRSFVPSNIDGLVKSQDWTAK